MGGQVEGLAWTEPGARNPIGASVNFLSLTGLLVSPTAPPVEVVLPTLAFHN
jgi:hypothetical protein